MNGWIFRQLAGISLGIVVLAPAVAAQAPVTTEAIRIQTTELPLATVGRPYQFPLVVTGLTAAAQWSLGSAPPWLTITNAGILQGTPLAAVDTTIQVQVSDAKGLTASALLRFRAVPAPSLVLQGSPTAVVNQPFRLEFVITGGVNPRPVTLVSGLIPAGLRLVGNTLEGTPTAAGGFGFVVRTQDQNGATAELAVTIRVLEAITIVTASPLPAGSVGVRYQASLAVRGGSGSFAWGLEQGALPPGLSLTREGVIQGTPTRAGDYRFTLRVRETAPGSAATDVREFVLTIRPLLAITSPGFLPEALSGRPYFLELQASGGQPPFTWSLVDGVLPAGIGLLPRGVLEGIPVVPGVFGFTLRVADLAGGATTRPFVLVVTGPPTQPRVELSPDFISFQAVEQGVAQTQVVNLSATVAATYTLSIQYLGAARDWLVVPAAVSVTPLQLGSIPITVDPRRLPPGTYSARILVEGPGAAALALPVNLLVTPGARTILATPTGLMFTAIQGGPPPPPRRLSVLNRGIGAMTWTLSGQTLSGGDQWLELPQRSFVSESGRATTTTIRVNPSGLAPGVYYARVAVVAPEAKNSPEEVVVVLHVRPSGDPIDVQVEPAGLVLGPGSEELFLSNPSAEPVQFFTSRLTTTAQPWFEVEPESGVIGPGAEVRLFLRVFLSGLPRGVYRGTLQLSFSNGQRRSVDVVLAAPAPAASFAEMPVRAPTTLAVSCTPTQLVPISSLIGNNFLIPAGWPTPVEVRVVDDCGAPMDRGSVSVSFTNGDPPLNLQPVGGGRWSGTWVGRNAITPQVTMTVRAEDPQTRLRGVYQATGGIQNNPEVPLLAAGGIVSAATYAIRQPLAPGMFISIFGSRLATTTAVAHSLPLNSSLGVTSVTLGGRLLPLQFVSDGQINAVVPFGLPLDTPLGLLVRRGTTLSVPEQVIVSSTQPGIFTLDQRGSGQGAIVDRFGRIVDAQSPVHAGEVISVYATGLGSTNPPVVAGEAAPASPLAQTQMPCQVTVGGVPASVSFCGVTPGFTGLYQVNVTIPQGVARGDRVPVIVSIEGRSSQAATVAVR